jgi:8-oxo-dGTP pyrophosphatase MutT (NUDIX family)
LIYLTFYSNLINETKKLGYYQISETFLYSNERYTFKEETHKIGNKGLHNFNTVDTFDWVLIIPEDEDGNLFLVEQYRPAWKLKSIEFPAGKIEDINEEPKVAANRELIEETGMKANKLKLLAIHRPVTWTSQKAYIYHGTDLKPDSQFKQDSSEDITVNKYSKDKVKDLIKKGLIFEIPTIAAFTYLSL